MLFLEGAQGIHAKQCLSTSAVVQHVDLVREATGRAFQPGRQAIDKKARIQLS